MKLWNDVTAYVTEWSGGTEGVSVGEEKSSSKFGPLPWKLNQETKNKNKKILNTNVL